MTTTWRDAIDRLFPGNQRLLWLCGDDNPDEAEREGYRRHVLSLAGSPSYPSLATQAGNALGAIGRVVGNVVTGQAVQVDGAEQARRLEICKTCERFRDGRCGLCGCHANLKTRLASEHCPDNPQRW